MGSRVSINNEDDCINDINNINENELDLSNIDKFQIKAIKQIIMDNFPTPVQVTPVDACKRSGS